MRNVSGIRPLGFPQGIRVERLDYTFYDNTTLATGTAGDTAFFSTGFNNRNKTKTNFEGQGQMPKTKEFHVLGLGLLVAAADDRDIEMVAANSYVEFRKGDKIYFDAPAWELPPGVGAQIERRGGAALAATPANDVFLGNQGIPALSNCRQLSVPIPLQPGDNFSFRWVMAASTLVATVSVFAIMRGVLFRPVS